MQQLSLLAMAACAAAQIAVSNPNATIQTCSDLDTCDLTDTQSICQVNGRAENGVGIVPSIIDLGGNGSAAIDNRNLSLTLIDNGLQPQYIPGLEYSRKTLYVGAPPSVNLTEGPPSCALMLQFYDQTFPTIEMRKGSADGVEKTETHCPFELSTSCLAFGIEDSLRTFNYSGQDTERLPRCEALAQHLENDLGEDPARLFCDSASGLVYGGAISGPDVQTEVASIFNTTNDDDGCRPVKPQSHTLYNVTSAMQLLYTDPSAGDLLRTGGRRGYTPIITVTYGNDDADPEVQALCMSVRSPEGNMLPAQSLNETSSGAAGPKRREAVWYAAAAALFVVASS
ncbi:hypothetical protein KC332_g2589 [Hortaea werneckii]|nr:hypothetical protein KC358_g4391 [Hortaea werneckii]KAI6844520.1 hypothetical protein KC350_g4765 [Hortaea werneckii]KAI6937880.1 hypothetical protein KC341_g5272 [Hortaea werneckii]KAI6947210.1 hypothetical protein KC348_g2665 [Hortaea werneckii]KAI6973719.1 hypothetical protein KC321_g5509 [Hortaea werneckii]